MHENFLILQNIQQTNCLPVILIALLNILTESCTLYSTNEFHCFYCHVVHMSHVA